MVARLDETRGRPTFHSNPLGNRYRHSFLDEVEAHAHAGQGAHGDGPLANALHQLEDIVRGQRLLHELGSHIGETQALQRNGFGGCCLACSRPLEAAVADLPLLIAVALHRS